MDFVSGLATKIQPNLNVVFRRAHDVDKGGKKDLTEIHSFRPNAFLMLPSFPSQKPVSI